MMESVQGLESVSCGGKVIVMDDLREQYPEKFNESGAMDYKWFEKEIRPNYNVFIRHDVGSISFTMMTKPSSEGGKGCQLTDLIEVALHQLKYFNSKFPCVDNNHTIYHLENALKYQALRTSQRVARGVEGKNEA